MWKLVIRLVGIIVLVAAVFIAIRTWQAQTYGQGPVEALGAPEPPTREIAFVANSVGGSVTLIDVAAREVVGEIDILPDGTKVSVFRDAAQGLGGQRLIERSGKNYAQDSDLSPDGRVLNVSRGHLGDVAAFEIASGELLWRVPIRGVRADHMAISPDGRTLFVAALSDNRVEGIDTTNARKTVVIPTGIFPHDVHVSPGGESV